MHYLQSPSSVKSTLMMKNMNPLAPSFCPPTSVFTQPKNQSYLFTSSSTFNYRLQNNWGLRLIPSKVKFTALKNNMVKAYLDVLEIYSYLNAQHHSTNNMLQFSYKEDYFFNRIFWCFAETLTFKSHCMSEDQIIIESSKLNTSCIHV